MNPTLPSFNNGMRAFAGGQLKEAGRYFHQFLNERPDHPDGLNMLGLVALRMGNPDAARQLIERAVSLRPGVSEYRANLAMVLIVMGRVDDGIEHYHIVLQVNPDLPEAHGNLGNALLSRGRISEAIDCFTEALRLRPDFADVHGNFGLAYHQLGKLDQAVEEFRTAIKLAPKHDIHHINLGNSLRARGETDAALTSFQKALACGSPSPAAICNNIASTLVDSFRLPEAMAAYDRALADDPKASAFASGRLLATHYLPEYSAQKLFEDHQHWNAQFAAALGLDIAAHSNVPDLSRRIRVGYVSPDFHEHPVAAFVESLLGHHDPAAVEIFCYADLHAPDAISERLQNLVPHWRNVLGETDQQLVERIRQDGIDILVDLAGHTSGNRLLVFARKPAPIQITYLGYPDTTGLTAIDFRLSDADTDPPGTTERFCSERILRLPRCFLCYSPPKDAPEPSVMPALERGYVTFGCFNAPAKINPPLVNLWCKILQATPGSRMILKCGRALNDDASRKRLMEMFACGGIGPDRLQLHDRLPSRREHLELLGSVDIALDTYPYHGTTITCESLWMGVPVVTLAGTTHVSRVGVSLLKAVGLGNLIAQNPEQYIQKAIRLALHPRRLARLRTAMRPRMARSPLTDGKDFATAVESVYREVWRQWCLPKSK